MRMGPTMAHFWQRNTLEMRKRFRHLIENHRQTLVRFGARYL